MKGIYSNPASTCDKKELDQNHHLFQRFDVRQSLQKQRKEIRFCKALSIILSRLVLLNTPSISPTEENVPAFPNQQTRIWTVGDRELNIPLLQPKALGAI